MSKPTILFASLAAVAAAAGCTAMMNAMTPKPRTADNPLVSGQPLEARTRAQIGTVSEKDCNTWPFEDTTTVNVSDAQICVDVKKHVMQQPDWTGEPNAERSQSVSISTDAGDGGRIDARKERASKIAQCFERGYNAQVGVWAFEYKGCAPNNGAVSKATKSLTVGHESWSFNVGAPAAGASPAS